MQIGDLIRYSGTGTVYLCLWVDPAGIYCKLIGHGDEQFLIKECNLEVVNEAN
jgi:hypothetical protein